MSHSSPDRLDYRLRIHLIGNFRVTRDGLNDEINLPTQKIEALLAYLILHPEKHLREKVAGQFWGESSETDARNSLRNALAVLNKKLGKTLINADRKSLQINLGDHIWVDVLAFEALADSVSKELHHADSHINFDLYMAELLPACYDDWVFPQREQFHNLLVEALLQLTQQMRAASEYGRAMAYARQVLDVDRANERAYQHLMFCHMASGDRNGALRQYELCRKALAEELAVEPSEATVSLYEWILQAPVEARPFAARITNLPIPMTSFVGRSELMAGVKRLLSSNRLLTLTGPGGSGKTRLANQAAIDLLDAYPDGIWWVDLVPLTEEVMVPQVIAKVLGVTEAPGQRIDQAIEGFLREKRLLLILDNCEHLISACAKFTEQLLEKCPDLTILATSREPMNIAAEQLMDVPGLALPRPEQSLRAAHLADVGAIRLFSERARAIQPDFGLDDQNVQDVANICVQLDGIPLAIELAAARSRALSPAQIASRLDDRFKLLNRGRRTDSPRHQTLQAAIDWSYSLLDEKEQWLFRRLGVFAGGFSLDAVKQICSDNPLVSEKILDVLTFLIEKSLVIRYDDGKGAVRYRLLETIRQFALVELKRADEIDLVREAHLAFYKSLVETAQPHLGFFLNDQKMVRWLGILTPEEDNIHAALVWCLTKPDQAVSGLNMAGQLHWFWLVYGRFSEGRNLLEQLMDAGKFAPDEIRALAMLSAGYLACWQGDFTAAREQLREAHALFESISDLAGAAFSLHGLGFAANGLGEFEAAAQFFDRCLQISREIEDLWLVSITLHFIAIGNAFQGNFELSKTQFEECIDLNLSGYGNSQGIGFSRFHLGRIARLNGDLGSSRQHLTEAFKLFHQIGDRRGLGYSLAGFACLALAEEEPQRAAQLFGAVEVIRGELGSMLEEILAKEIDQTKETVRQILGDQTFDQNWRIGQSLDLKVLDAFVLDSQN